MIDFKQKLVLFFFFTILLALTGYAVFNYSMYNPMLYIEDSLFLPFMERTEDSSLWNMPKRFVIFPDTILYNFFTLFTDNIILQISLVVTSLFFLLYCILLRSVWNIKETPLYTNITVAIFQWAILVAIVLYDFTYLPSIIIPNGYVGLIFTSFLSFFFFSQILQKQNPFYIGLFSLFVAITAFSDPFFALYFLIIPLFLSIVFHKETIKSPLSKAMLILILFSSSFLGFLLQYFIYPIRYDFVISNLSFFDGFLIAYTQHPFLIFFTIFLLIALCLFVILSFFYSLFSLLSFTIFYMLQIIFWALLSSLVVSIFGFLNVYVFLSITILLSLCFILPVVCLLFLKMCSLQFLSKAYVIIIFSSVLLVLFTKGHILQDKKVFQGTQFLSCLDNALSSVTESGYVLIPENIFSKMFLFSKHTFKGVPYNVDTFFLSNRKIDGNIEDKKYSFFIVENKADNLKLPSLDVFKQPVFSRICGNYEVLYYNPPFVMPKRTVLASYTTKLGVFISKNIDKSIEIPLPENFSFYGEKLSSLRILSQGEKNFLLFIFPQNVKLDTIPSITSFSLTTNSSALRHFISALRREIPQLNFLLPLEEKNSVDTSQREYMYTLPTGEHVVVLPLKHSIGESLIFLSIAEKGKKPVVILEYPKLPILLKELE